MTEYRSSFPVNKYISIKGTLKIHQVTTISNDKSIMPRQCSCGCKSYLNNEEACESIAAFRDCEHLILSQLHNFNEKSQVECNQNAVEDICDDEFDELEIEYFKSEASKLILKGDIAVIKTGDDHPYYLLKLTKDPYETQETITDSYNYKFPPYHTAIEGNYLELHKEQKDSDLYCVDYRKTAMISAFGVIGNFPMPEIINEKKNGKLVAMYVISSDIHQALYELVCANDN